MTIPRDIVEARKRVLLHLLFAFIDDRRGTCVTAEEQDGALREFLNSTNAIPSKVTKHRGKATHGGDYSIKSLREAIRTAIREHGHGKRHKAHPVASFFNEGQDAVDAEYRRKCVEAFQFHGNGPTLYDPGHENEHVQFAAENQALDDRSKRGAGGLLKEEVNLKPTWETTDAPVQEAPRQRAPPKRFAFDDFDHEDTLERAIRKEVTPSEPESFQREVDETPPRNSEKPSKKKSNWSRPSETPYPHLEASPQTHMPTPSGRARIPSKKIKQYLKDIDHSLQHGVRKAFEASSLDWALPIKFTDKPSGPLRELYQLCLGRNWHVSSLYFSPSEDMYALRFVVALVGAGVYSRILCPGSSGVEPGPEFSSIIRQGCGALDTLESRGKIEDYSSGCFMTLNMQTDLAEMTHTRDESYHQHVALATARNECFGAYVLRPLARSKAARVETALNEHLSAEPTYAAALKSENLALGIRQAVDAAFETAMLLAAELDACGDYVQPTWFESGQKFETRRMMPSVHATDDGRAQQAIDVTLLPGVDTRLPDGSWNVSCPAIVHRSSRTLDE